MKRCPAWCCVLVLALTMIACAGEDKEYNRKRSEEADKTAAELRKKIEAEIKSLPGHAWAGSYYFGDGMGVNVILMLAPKNGYLFEWHGCMGLYDRNYGKVAFKDGKIKLSFTFKNERKGFQGIADELIPIPWGERMYLVPADGIAEFCNEVNSGDEPRTRPHGMVLLRRGDEKKKVAGLPKVPDAYRRYLLSAPLKATITKVKPFKLRPSISTWKFKDTPVMMNAGKGQGVREGMKLYVITPDVVEWVIVTKVEEDTSEAVMTQCGEKEAGPQVGWKLSTRPRWRQADETKPATESKPAALSP